MNVPIEHPFELDRWRSRSAWCCSRRSALVVGIYAETWDHTSFIHNIVILPLTFVGGVFYSVDVLPSPWEELSHFNPIFYLVNAVRYGFLGESDVSVWLSLGVVAALAIPAYAWAQYLFTTGKRLKELERRIVGCRALPAAGRVARAGGAREARGASATRTTGAGRCRASATPARACYVLGLAPAAHGGNRTGRVFTGDRSGDWLFARAAPRRLRQPADVASHRGDGLRAARRLDRRRRPLRAAGQQADCRGARQLPALRWREELELLEPRG